MYVLHVNTALMFHTSKAGSYCIQNISITTVYAFLSPFITTSLKLLNACVLK